MLDKVAQQEMFVKKRDGRLIPFERELISRAMQKAFRADMGLAASQPLEIGLVTEVEQITSEVVNKALEASQTPEGVDVERIQDFVEQELMRAEYFSVARRYILYRAEHTKIRQLRAEERMESTSPFPEMMVQRENRLENFDFARLQGL